MTQNQGSRGPRMDWGELRSGARTLLILQGILGVLMGLVFLFLPFESILALSIVFGAWILVSGLSTVIGHFIRDGEHRSGWSLLSGIVSALAGLIVLVLPGSAAVAMVYIMAFWAIVLGVLHVVSSFQLKGLGATYWWGELLAGLLAIALGALMLFNLGAALLGVIWAIGAYGLVSGISQILLGIRLRKPRG